MEKTSFENRKVSVEGAKAIILESLEDSKAEDIVVIDLKGKSSLADVMVIASAGSNRHVGAIAERLLEKIKEEHLGPVHVEGLADKNWILIDVGDIIVHLFYQETRAFYNLEKLWQMPYEAHQSYHEGKNAASLGEKSLAHKALSETQS